tara:strand:+ start:668 stop:964 length:297 start_codon:yes stop_codon:yes gene_type:complete
MANFNEYINGETPVLVDFFAEWCGPCKVQAPILNSLKQEVGKQLNILKIDVDKNQAVAQKYAIKGVPTLILFHQGKIIWRKSGVVQANEIKQHLAQIQ